MPKYDYKCDVCNHEYSEIRDVTDPQFKVKCVVDNCAGSMKEAND